MIDLFFDALKAGNPLYWGLFLLVIFLLFNFFKGLGKFVIFLLILAAIAYTIFYFNPYIFESLFDQAKEITREINIEG